MIKNNIWCEPAYYFYERETNNENWQKLGIAVFSKATLNAHVITAYADENTDSTSSKHHQLFLTSLSRFKWSESVMQPESVASSQQDNIVSDGGHVNVEVILQHSAMENMSPTSIQLLIKECTLVIVMTVSDLYWTWNLSPGSQGGFTLVGTRDESQTCCGQCPYEGDWSGETLNEITTMPPFTFSTAEEVASGQTLMWLIIRNTILLIVKMLSYSIYNEFF